MLGRLGLCPDCSPFGLLELDRIRHAENEHTKEAGSDPSLATDWKTSVDLATITQVRVLMHSIWAVPSFCLERAREVGLSSRVDQ